MFNHYYTEGVILSIRSSREADNIFVLYTKDFGRISVVGKSIRKGGSKLKAKMSLFSLVRIGFITGKNCNTLIDVDVVIHFPAVRSDLGKLSLFYRLTEVILSVIIEEEQDENIFYLIKESFFNIDRMNLSSGEMKLFYCFFSFQLLYFLGYKLYIKSCAVCSKTVQGSGYFSAEEGGVVCKNCYANYKERCYLEQERQKRFIYISDINSLQAFFENSSRDFLEDEKMFLCILKEYLGVLPKQSNNLN